MSQILQELNEAEGIEWSIRTKLVDKVTKVHSQVQERSRKHVKKLCEQGGWR